MTGERLLEVASLDGIGEAMAISDELAEEIGLTAARRIYLRLATEEACTNAWEYCRQAGEPAFRVLWQLAEARLMITVSQRQGVFSLDLEPQKPQEPRGRGLLLIRGLTDGAEVIVHGEIVALQFWMSGVNSDDGAE